VRPFCERAEIRPRECSRGVQRALTDFGVEDAFVPAAARFQEHYGWSISPSVVRRWTLHHARGSAVATPRTALPPSREKTLITGLDGSMIPIVCPAAEGDRRKNKTLIYREVRVAFARRKEDASARYGVTLGDALAAGLMWRETAQLAGLNEETKVHALGDGAPWIVNQCDRQFGTQATFLVDLQHVTGYLAAAAPTCAATASESWLTKQKQDLLENKVAQVLSQLERFQESALKDAHGQTPPVRQAHQYIAERQDWMAYAAALEAGLPVGSGEAESAHRHLVQARLKKAGAWWRETNAEPILQLRTLRANDHWQTYWKYIASLN
jgi:hypothetical protein